MEKIVKKQSVSPLCYSFLLNIIVLMTMLLVFYPVYETNDDADMALIVNGAYGTYDYHMMFSNAFLGKLLCGLNKLGGSINWYSVLQYVVIFCSFWIVSYVLIKEHGRFRGMMMSILLETVFGYECFILLQFTKTSGVAAIAGGILIFASVKENKRNKCFFIALGSAFLLTSMMYRHEMFFLCILVLIPVGMTETLFALKEDLKKGLKNYSIIAGVFFMVVLTALGIYEMGLWEYEGEEWNVWSARREAESKLLDDFMPYYQDVPWVYESLNISWDDKIFFEMWNTADTEKFNTDVLTILVAAKDGYQLGMKAELRGYLKQFPGRFWEITVFPIVLMLILLTAVTGKKRMWFLGAVESIFVMGLYFYMYIIGRVIVNRVDVPLWFGVCVCILYIWKPRKEWKLDRKQMHIVKSLVCTVLFSGMFIGNKEQLRINVDMDICAKQREVMQYIADNKEHIYLGTINSLPITSAWSIFERPQEGYLSNYYSLGGCSVGTAFMNRILENYDISNVYRDIVNKENAYIFAAYDASATEAYIQRNYNSSAVLQLVDEINGYKIYKVVAE